MELRLNLEALSISLGLLSIFVLELDPDPKAMGGLGPKLAAVVDPTKLAHASQPIA